MHTVVYKVTLTQALRGDEVEIFEKGELRVCFGEYSVENVEIGEYKILEFS